VRCSSHPHLGDGLLSASFAWTSVREEGEGDGDGRYLDERLDGLKEIPRSWSRIPHRGAAAMFEEEEEASSRDTAVNYAGPPVVICSQKMTCIAMGPGTGFESLTWEGAEAIFVENTLKGKWSGTQTLYEEKATFSAFREYLRDGPKILHIIAAGGLTNTLYSPETPFISLRDDDNPEKPYPVAPDRLRLPSLRACMEGKTDLVVLSSCFGMANYGEEKEIFFGSLFTKWMGAKHVIGHESILLTPVALTFVWYFYITLSNEEHDWEQIGDAYAKAITSTNEFYDNLIALGVGIGVGVIVGLLTENPLAGIDAGSKAWFAVIIAETLISIYLENNLSNLLFNIDGLRHWEQVNSDGGSGGSEGSDSGSKGGSDGGPSIPPPDYGKPYLPPGGTIVIYPV